MEKKLSGKTALITGAGRGIGRATAILFAQHGADVVLVSRTSDELYEVVDRCNEHEVRALIDPLNLANYKDVNFLFEMLSQLKVKVDILINNAATFRAGLIAEMPLSDFVETLQINLVAPFMLAHGIIPFLLAQGGGTIVNVSSLSGCFGVEKFPGFGAYNISKYGLWGLTEILALENRDRNIRINQISLSGVDTAMFREASPPGVEPDLTPAEVAAQILYLASADSFPLTGHNLILTGMPRKKDSE